MRGRRSRVSCKRIREPSPRAWPSSDSRSSRPRAAEPSRCPVLSNSAPVAPAEPAAALRLKITETFVSIQGEADAVGWPTLFIRLTGCPLRCVYCDTQYAFYGGEWTPLDVLVDRARVSGVRYVCVTGGEPLAQKACHELLARLCDAGFRVSLETSGAMDVSRVDPRVSRVVDLKSPGSGESKRN